LRPFGFESHPNTNSQQTATLALEKIVMHIVLYGATGQAGSRILTELLSRGHQVTAIVRTPAKLAAQQGLSVAQGDVSSVDSIAERIKGADAVVSAYAPPKDDTDQLIGATDRLIEAVKKAGVPRLLIVGGAGSLEVAPGVTIIDSGHVPAEWLPIAVSHAKTLDLAKKSDINWTYFSPAAFLVPGERTGKFRLGTNQLIANEKGDSRISLEDYAIALVDELESPKHERERFTIGY
jgi:uncharacterized protein